MDRHHVAHRGATARDRRGRCGAHHGAAPGGSLAADAGARHARGRHGAMPRHAHGLRTASGSSGTGEGTRVQAPRGHRHSLPGVCIACTRAGTRLRAPLRRGHALLGQHDDRALSPVPVAVVGPSRRDHLSRIPRRLSRRSPLPRRQGEGHSVPDAPAVGSAFRFLPAHMPHVRRLHQRAGGHHRRLHGRAGRAVAARAQRTRGGVARSARG